MTTNRRGGRGTFLVGLLSCVVLFGASPSWGQTPVPKTPVAAPSAAAAVKAVSSPVTVTPSAEPQEDAAGRESADPGEKVLHLPSQEQEPEHETDPNAWKKAASVGHSTFFDTVRKVTWAMALVCFLIWLFGKFAGRSTLERLGVPSASSSLIEILEKKRLSPGRSVMLLRVGPKVLAVAVTESGFRTLTEMDVDQLLQHQDEKVEVAPEPDAGLRVAATPREVARHYLSIIPGLGVKK